MKVHIRWMIRRDTPEVMAIDAKSYPTAWTEEEFLAMLRRRNVIGMVAEHGDAVVGFMIYELRKTEILVSRFAVDPDFRRRGVGRAMVAKLVSKLDPRRRRRLRTAVRETDLGGQRFLKATGWTAYHVERDGFDVGCDAYNFELRAETVDVAAAAFNGRNRIYGG